MPMPPLRPENRFRSRACVGSALAVALSLGPYAAGATVSGEDPVSADPVPADPVSAAVWPVDPHPLVAAFDPPGCDFCAGHRGVDLGTVPSRPVRSAIAGTVTYAGDLAGRGVVVVDDGTRRVTYEPVTASLARGAQVAAGDLLGHVALVGSHCYPQQWWFYMSGYRPLATTHVDTDGCVSPLALLAYAGDPWMRDYEHPRQQSSLPHQRMRPRSGHDDDPARRAGMH